MPPVDFEAGFIATVVLLGVAVTVIAALAATHSKKSTKPAPAPAPPATLAAVSGSAPAAAVANSIKIGTEAIRGQGFQFKKTIDLDASAYRRVVVNASSVLQLENSKDLTRVVVYLRVYSGPSLVAEQAAGYDLAPNGWETVTPLLQAVVINPGKLRAVVEFSPQDPVIVYSGSSLNISAIAA